MTEYAGIDYGLGKTNIDPINGIRYGVINQINVLEAWAESSIADYGKATCPKCGNEATEITDPRVPVLDDELSEGWIDDGRDHACIDCKYTFDGDQAYGDQPLGFYLDDGEYQATCGDDGDIMIIKSPYYTRAQFCSPCAPGAAYLMNPCADGPRAYCFAPDWFANGAAPYPIYCVANDQPLKVTD